MRTMKIFQTHTGRRFLAVCIVFNLGSAGANAWVRHSAQAPIGPPSCPHRDWQDRITVTSPSPSPLPSVAAPPPPPPPPTSDSASSVPRFTMPNQRATVAPNGKPPGPALAFREQVDDNGGLQFVLVLGSDARSGNPEKARSDSIHILALDPKTRSGTILGIPRDSYVDIPGHGKRKINEALHIGGAALAVRTIREVTGLPVQYFIPTAFEGIRSIVERSGGVDAYVPCSSVAIAMSARETSHGPRTRDD